MTDREFKSTIVQKGRLLPGIHGLRGLAALAVALFHLEKLVGITPPDFFEFIGRDFGFSVHLFFILSAFSLMYSTESRTNYPNWLSENIL
jgi:peptidoglycan/LPS O-acetylase OafA/YrhL